MSPEHGVPLLRWRRDLDLRPAPAYRAEGFEIIWDPAGQVEDDDDGGWQIWRGDHYLGVGAILAKAKLIAEEAR